MTGISGPDGGPAYSTVQTMVYRLEAKGAVRRVERIRNYDIFAAAITRDMAARQMVIDYLRFFDGRVWPFLEHSIAMFLPPHAMRESRTYGSVRAKPNGRATRPPSFRRPTRADFSVQYCPVEPLPGSRKP